VLTLFAGVSNKVTASEYVVLGIEVGGDGFASLGVPKAVGGDAVELNPTNDYSLWSGQWRNFNDEAKLSSEDF